MGSTRQWTRLKILKGVISNIATGNVLSWIIKDQETINELKKRRIDMCSCEETRKKGKGTRDCRNYIMEYI